MLTLRPLLILLVVIIVAALVIKRRMNASRGNSKSGEGQDGEDPGEPDRDLNQEFFDNAEGETSIPFLRIYSSQDEMLIRSILQSAGISTYQDTHHFGDLYPGVQLLGSNGSILRIYESSRAEAELLVVDYMKNRVEQLTGNPVATTQALAEAVALLNGKSASRNPILPEFVSGSEPEGEQ